MEKYLTAKEISDKWGISVRAVQTMCVNGKIEGAKNLEEFGQFQRMLQSHQTEG